jgi:hypothetical protein
VLRLSVLIALLASIGVFAVALPHTGLLGFGRPLFIDEAINIDSGVSFLHRGWVTYRGVSQAYSPIISSGVIGSVLPALATEMFGTYIAGRVMSALQDSVALGLVGLFLGAISGWRILPLFFISLALLIPALPASLVYTQAEPLSFSALGLGFVLYSARRPPLLVSAAFCLAVHFKLLAIVDLTGGLFGLAAYASYAKLSRERITKVTLASITAICAGAVLWQLIQMALTPTWSEYLASWDLFFSFFQKGGSGLKQGGPAISRWVLLTTSASEFGSYSVLSKSLILGISIFPCLGVLKLLKLRSSARPALPQELVAAFSGAALFHLAWWFFKSDQIWIRHGFLGLFSACAVAALIAAEMTSFRKFLNLAAILLFLLCVSFKAWRGVGEFRGKAPTCLPADTHFDIFCDPMGTPWKYNSWLR